MRNLLMLLGLCSLLPAPTATAAELTPVTEPNYKQASRYTSTYLRQFLYSTSVRPVWIGKTDSFIYSYRTREGRRYYRVDPRKRTKDLLFNHGKLAEQMSEMTRKPTDANQLDLSRLSIDDAGDKIKYVVANVQYQYDLKAEKLTKLGKAPPSTRPTFSTGSSEERRDRIRRFLEERRREEERKEEEEKKDSGTEDKKEDDKKEAKKEPPRYRAYSPDKKKYVYALKHNLYLAEEGKEEDAVQLSKDGVEDLSFGGGDGKKARPRVTWSKDSKAFYISRRDQRGVKELFLIDSLASPRPKLSTYKYPLPGEEAIRKSQLWAYHQASKKLIRIPTKWKDESYSNVHWGKKSGELRFTRVDRLRRNLEVCSFTIKTGKSKCLIADGFEDASLSYQSVRNIPETDEMIWWSERSGWGRYYLYGRDGKLKNAITPASFRASRIVAVNAEKRLLYFVGNGREKVENVYYEHLYCVHLDGKGLTLMDPGNAYHRSSLSPTRQFVVDNCSRVDMAPISVVRDAKGKPVMELEKADLSRLTEVGWTMPERFDVKAADGVTDIYGNLWKPFHFDPKKKYPIIAHVYPGPQQEGVSHTFSATRSEQQLAQLNFIVIQVGHRGGSPRRSKAYQKHSYFNMRDYALADTKSAIEQLAARYPFIDIDRVGIYGHSGGGFMSAAAMLQKPYNEFFKAAVASAGNHDNNIYSNSWAERYHGMKVVPIKEEAKKGTKPPDKGTEGSKDGKEVKEGEAAKPKTRFEIKVPTNAELAANLKGALLLVHGELDNNVHPANTMRLVDALIKENKRFDMLILPGTRHSFGKYRDYFRLRMWEFFAEHLLDDHPRGADLFDRGR